jgi:hypothetical protein
MYNFGKGEKLPIFLNVSFANNNNKDELIMKLLAILKTGDFCGYEPSVSRQLNELLVNLKDNVWFVLEYPYVDRHYRDTYYSYHSSKFKKTGRNCIRVHIFEDEITQNDLLTKNNGLNERYRGFFIIRPLPLYILGRSLISPRAFKADNFVCCLTKDRISLLGNELTVHGFPHIAQDTETHTCAESSLWSFIEYFGSKYRRYKPLLPSQVITTLLDNSEHRILPSVGLTEKELAKCLNVNGFQCLIYPFASPSGTKLFFRLLKIYIESGIPLLLYLANKSNAHAVMVIGHETNDSLYDVKNFFRPWEYPWVDASVIDKKLVFIDDNMPPYKTADLFHPTAHYYKPEMRDMVIKSFIVSLPVHMFLVAEKAYALMNEIFNDPKIGLQTFGGKWVTRLLLTGSHSFKNFVYEYDNKMADKLKELLLRLALPKFIWVCEVYKAQDFNPNGYCSGLLIIDATSNGKSLVPVLWYTIDNQLFTHDNVAWNQSSKPIVPFRMCTYKNNLKGAWNQWKS